MPEPAERKKLLKEIIEKLHSGASPEDVKEEFKEIIRDVSPEEIARVEEELVKDGMPRTELQRLCDVHLRVFQETLEIDKQIAPPGHPIHTLMEEHKMLLQFAGNLKDVADRIGRESAKDSIEEAMKAIDHIVKHLKESESHYVREENVLFPYLEKHGITEPPAIMWMEHDKIRAFKKEIFAAFDARNERSPEEFGDDMRGKAIALAEMLSNHFNKENNILFPTAIKVIDEAEWPDIISQFDELGYCCFTPKSARTAPKRAAASVSESAEEGAIPFETGVLSKEIIGAIFNNLPVDITFVDSEDTVRYFSDSPERIFPRTKAIIGRKVQQCHPQKSVHVVNQILDDFRDNRKEVADFWIRLNDRLIYIRYFPLRDENGGYLGCLEVTQDITDIKEIEGEKRLL